MLDQGRGILLHHGPGLAVVCGVIALLFIPAFLVQPMLAGLFNILGFILLVVWNVGVGRTLLKLQ